MGKAKTITDAQLNELLQQVAVDSYDALRDYTIILLSFKAGLRAQEIAGLTWRDVMDATGRVGIEVQLTSEGPIERCLRVPKAIAKKGHERLIPMHPALIEVLTALASKDSPPHGNVIKGAPTKDGEYRAQRVSPNTLQRYLSRLYRRHGLDCTSHSGRRTWITKLVRMASAEGCSIADVQSAAGHKYLDTTERYIELSPFIGNLIRRG